MTGSGDGRSAVIDADTIAGFWPGRPADIAPSTLRATMDRHGVDRACVVSARGIFYDFIAGNSETLDWCRAEPRFIPVGTLDLRILAGYRQEIRRLSEAGVKMWRLFPEYQDWSFDQACFRRAVAALEDAGAVLFVSGQPSAVARAIKGSRLPVILSSHFYQLGDLLANLEEGAEYYLSLRLTHGPGVLDTLLTEVGAGRLIFGSNAPLSAMGAVTLRLQETAQAAGLSPEDRAAIMGGNLARLLGEA